MKKVLPFVLVLVFISGCFGNIQSPADMTDKQRSAWFNEIYVEQYDSLKAEVAIGNLTEDRKNILRTKKAVLRELEPLLHTYTFHAETGEVPPAALVSHIFQLLRLLGVE